MGVLAKIMAVICLAALLSGFDLDYQERNQRAVRTVRHVVTEGETLWSIGEQYYDGRKPLNEYMSDLRKANGFDAGSGRKYLYPGEVVLVRTTLPKEGE